MKTKMLLLLGLSISAQAEDRFELTRYLHVGGTEKLVLECKDKSCEVKKFSDDFEIQSVMVSYKTARNLLQSFLKEYRESKEDPTPSKAPLKVSWEIQVGGKSLSGMLRGSHFSEAFSAVFALEGALVAELYR